MATVQRLHVLARLDDPAVAMARAEAAAAAGDESWADWVADYRRGNALILCLEVSLEVSNGGTELVHASNTGVFVERDVHPPRIEQQVAELVVKDFGVLAAKLRTRGYQIHLDELGDMYVHVELDADLRRSLSS